MWCSSVSYAYHYHVHNIHVTTWDWIICICKWQKWSATGNLQMQPSSSRLKIVSSFSWEFFPHESDSHKSRNVVIFVRFVVQSCVLIMWTLVFQLLPSPFWLCSVYYKLKLWFTDGCQAVTWKRWLSLVVPPLQEGMFFLLKVCAIILKLKRTL